MEERGITTIRISADSLYLNPAILFESIDDFV